MTPDASSDANTLALKDVPTASKRYPVIGHGIAAMRRPLEFVSSLPRYGPVVRIYLGPAPAYVFTTPELIREVSLGDSGRFHRNELRDAMKELSTGAVNVLNGPEHELRRRMLAPAFKQRQLNAYGRVAADIANSWSNGFADGDQVNFVESAHDLVLTTISSTLFTAEFSQSAQQQIRENVPWLLSEVIRRTPLPPPVRASRVLANRKFVRKSADLRAAIGAVVAEYRRGGTDYNDMLSALIAHTDDESGATLGDEDIIDELILALGAGVGSQGSMLSWLLYEVSRDEGVAGRVYEEIDRVVGGEPVALEHVSDLPYLRQVLQETLRYWAPWVSLLTTSSDIQIGPVTLPAESNVVFSPYMISHDDRFFDRADHFDPDRWAADRIDDMDKRNWLPFGVGHRRCPGNHYAMLAISLQAAALLAVWRPTLDAGYTVRPTNNDFTASPSALPITLRRR